MFVYPCNMLRFTVIFLVLLCPLAQAAPAMRPADEFFGLTRLHTVHLRVSSERWRMMQPTRRSGLAALLGLGGSRPTTQKGEVEGERLDPSPFGNQYAYVKATVQIDGRTLTDAGLRFKGNSSYSMAGGELRKPYKLDFNRFVENGEFLGLTSLNLNNNALDPSQMREALSYDIFRQAGVPAPRTAFALVHLTVDGQRDREFLGLYTIIEEVNKDFLKERFGSSKGLLLKPERAQNLRLMGDTWAAHEAVYEPKTDAPEKLCARFVEFLKLIHQSSDKEFAQRIGDYLELDAFARFLAANVLMANLDSFLSTGHNFYIYLNPRNEKVHWIPWDLNLSFGSFSWVGTGKDQATLSIHQPYAMPNRLLERVAMMESFDRAYRGHLREFLGSFFTAGKLIAQVDAMEAVLAKAEKAAKAAGKSGSPTTQPGSTPRLRAPDLRAFIPARIESVKAQLDGQAEGYIPSFRRIGPPATRPALPTRRR